MTIGSPTTRWTGCCMPCATPITGANSRRWSTSRRKSGRAGCSACRACHATHLARDRGVPLDPRLVDQFRRRYGIIVTEGLAFHQNQPPLATPPTNGRRKRRGRPARRTGHNLLLRLSTHKDDVLRFLDDPAVPFSRVDDWRGSDRLLGSCRSPAAFARAGASFLTMAPFPVAAHQTGRADFLHPAFT